MRNVTVLLGGVALWATLAGSPDRATAQVDCDAVPAGPARTDCYIGLSRIHRQKSEIAVGVSQQQTDSATYRKVTGSSVGKAGKKVRRKSPAR